MVFKNSLVALIGLAFGTAAYCQGVAILGNNGSTVSKLKLTTVADAKSGLNAPSDIGFNPKKPTEMYVVNHADNSAIVISLDADGKKTKSRVATGLASEHFMPYPTAIAFAPKGFFATAHDIDTITQDETPPDFMGPTLWRVDWFEGGHASHIDMLHNSPSATGIAWVYGNTYVVNDGMHGSLTVYDFRNDHNYGGADHSDGVALRYADGLLKRVEGVPSHVVYDNAAGVAYAVDTGHNRVVSVDLGLDLLNKAGFEYVSVKNTSYKVNRNINPNYDGSIQRYVDGAKLNVVAEGSKSGLSTPSGIALKDGILYVSDYANGKIVALDQTGKVLDTLALADISPALASTAISGIEFDVSGNLFISDVLNSKIYRIAAPAAQTAPATVTAK